MDIEFQQLVTEITERLEKIGLYTVNHGGGVMPTSEEAAAELMENPPEDPRQAMEEGKAKIFLTFTCAVGEVAWSDRVLNPEKHKTDNEFRMMMPDEVEIQRDSILDEVAEFLNHKDDDDDK